ncbi:hypothetical protein M758_11G000400 [Ceratodon purpureus]|nr:hypothetical protein M758_11G000400 [Ceratodon purpureus]
MPIAHHLPFCLALEARRLPPSPPPPPQYHHRRHRHRRCRGGQYPLIRAHSLTHSLTHSVRPSVRSPALSLSLPPSLGGPLPLPPDSLIRSPACLPACPLGRALCRPSRCTPTRLSPLPGFAGCALAA